MTSDCRPWFRSRQGAVNHISWLCIKKRQHPFAEQAEVKGLKLDVDADIEQIVRADRGLLAQILRNLISNAVRYTDLGEIHLRCTREDGSLRFSVTDTGIGIPANQLDLVFDEFHQVVPDTQELRRGMGLGLAIVQRVAKVMGTQVEVKSTIGQGSCFSFMLPEAKHPAVDVAAPRVTENDSEGDGAAILVIDDDPQVLAALQIVLSLEGFKLATGSTAEEALGAVQTFVPELIISDFNLGQSGSAPEIVRQIRGELDRPVPALIITVDTSVTLGDLENTELLIKPVEGPALLTAIRRSLRNGN